MNQALCRSAPYVAIVAVSALLQAFLIHSLRPDPQLPLLQRKVQGMYFVEGGELGTNVVTRVDDLRIHCDVNYLGRFLECPNFYAGSRVEVTLVEYPSISGPVERVAEINALGTKTSFTREQMDTSWFRSSLFSALTAVIYMTIGFGGAYHGISSWWRGRG